MYFIVGGFLWVRAPPNPLHGSFFYRFRILALQAGEVGSIPTRATEQDVGKLGIPRAWGARDRGFKSRRPDWFE